MYPIVLTEILLLALAYLVGAIPFAFLFARMKGVDIRKVGSGNIGATNVFRAVSKPLGILTFAADALKGFVPVFLFPRMAQMWGAPESQIFQVLCGCAAIAGHNWPVYVGFKGGKGVSTSAGMLLGLAPASAGCGVLVWAALVFSTGYVSVGSIGAAVAVPVAGWWLYARDGLFLPMVLTVLGALVVWKHRGNIRRLIDGTERRFRIHKQGCSSGENQ